MDASELVISLSPQQRKRLRTIQYHIDNLKECEERRRNGENLALDKLLPSLDFAVKNNLLKNLAPLAALILSLKGKPYMVDPDYRPMMPMMAFRMPRRRIYKTGRQVSKSTSAAANICLRGALIPYFHILNVAPRFEQIRRFSTNYVRPFIENSPFHQLLKSVGTEKSVLQRTLANNSILHFTFAFLDCERARGISAGMLVIDEAQDMDYDFLPILAETMSASPYGPFEQYFGTPKTYDNTLEILWQDSSQGEWVMKCSAGHDNVPTVDGGIFKMIRKEGLFCKTCDRQLNPANGQWVHAFRERLRSMEGHHIPQPIMKMHWDNPEKWSELIRKMNEYPQAKFYNEVIGESCDTGARSLTLPQLREACRLPWNNTVEDALKKRSAYPQVIMGIDWGGYGEEEISYTAISIIGRGRDGHIHVLYGERLMQTRDEMDEVKRIIDLWQKFRPQFLAHDTNGSGATRETLLRNMHFPEEKLIPIMWVHASRSDMIVYKPPSEDSDRGYYVVDKARIFSLCFACIKNQFMLFPNYNSGKSVFDDWLALYTEKHEMHRGSDIYLIKRVPKKSDDFAQATVFATTAMWHSTQSVPSFKDVLPQIDPATLAKVSPDTWNVEPSEFEQPWGEVR